jgi:hypothetical protein
MGTLTDHHQVIRDADATVGVITAKAVTAAHDLHPVIVRVDRSRWESSWTLHRGTCRKFRLDATPASARDLIAHLDDHYAGKRSRKVCVCARSLAAQITAADTKAYYAARQAAFEARRAADRAIEAAGSAAKAALQAQAKADLAAMLTDPSRIDDALALARAAAGAR